jgi:hypothetical protein
VARFRYRFECARRAARGAAEVAKGAVASACDASRLARDALAHARAAVESFPASAMAVTGDAAWAALVDRERWVAVCAARERACIAALEDAQRNEERARATCEVARRRYDGFERHRERALEAFRAEEERREEAERDEARVFRP